MFNPAADVIRRTQSAAGYHSVITGDGSPSTLWTIDRWPLLPENEATRQPKTLTPHFIRSFTPGAKIIVSLRNPVDRLYSHYFNNLGKFGEGRETGSAKSFHRLVKHDVTVLEECMQKRDLRECVYDGCINGDFRMDKLPVRAGMYSLFLKDWLAVFPRHQFLVTRFEDYTVNRTRTLNEIFEFLDVGSAPESLMSRASRSRSAKQRNEPMLDTTRQILQSLYKPFNEELAGLLADDRFLWK